MLETYALKDLCSIMYSLIYTHHTLPQGIKQLVYATHILLRMVIVGQTLPPKIPIVDDFDGFLHGVLSKTVPGVLRTTCHV